MKKPIPFGKYYLLERINVGGMAEVYRAKAYGVEGFERLVAVKRILPNVAEDKEFIKMFVDEAKLAVQLNHANIAQIFDLGMVGSDYYIALEHVHGRDLRACFERCREQGDPMPIAMACFATMKVCEGLDYAHNKRDSGGRELGLVHRDVSPQNVLVSFDGEGKLIDFGIAKAAGRGSQTEAGILKGKFGYMSPEQVRGLPIDRRSDVFACGIVLYEMLTGERLFVGESDFSTLEKVRNVEILPPTTFNRRIPDELERIVLKALAKDVEDRYQNAIDLHDELQAFVYTSGEFYSRKDLATWMKRNWSKELTAERAKMEEYKKFSPQQMGTPQPPPPPRSARGSAPPPIPGRRTSGKPSTPPPIPGAARRSGPQPAQQMAAVQPAQANLDWDDDELETSIYDGPEQDYISTAKDSPRPIAAAGAIETSPHPRDRDQDLAEIVEKARDWKPQDAPHNVPPPRQTASGSGPKLTAPPTTLETTPAPNPPLPAPARRTARGTDSPPAIEQASRMAPAAPAAPHHGAESSAVAALAAMAERQRSTYEGPTVDLMDRPFSERRTSLVLAISAGALLLIGGIVAVVLLLGGDDVETQAASAPAEAAEKTELSRAVLKDTGFDLVVAPSGLKAEVRLDGKTMGVAPLRFRNIQPGEHKVEVIAPNGYFNQVQTIEVEAGEAPRMTIELDGVPSQVAIKSAPEGAIATLIGPDGSRQELGETPTEAKVDLGKGYKVELSKAGFELATVELEAGETEVLGTLSEAKEAEKDEVAEVTGAKRDADEPATRRRAERRERRRDKRMSRDDEATAALEKAETKRTKKVEPKKPEPTKDVAKPAPAAPSSAKGTLLLGSKPPCEIYINGKRTGLKTPQRKISLPEGKHKVVLVNNEHGIKDSFFVKIAGGKQTKVIRNLTEQMK
ncbi:MAG: protein kinase [Deltaproteobacteria bacterium]|nr:protein kinase [Deltaproteobacteria bacterium]